MTTRYFLGDKATERDRFELDLSDTFDVKASIVLLILTFAGTISATMLTAQGLAGVAKTFQILVIACVIISGALCVVCLWPKVYLIDDLPATYADAVPSLGQSDAEQLENINKLSFDLANTRIKHNHALNVTKAWALNGAFWSMSIGLFVELFAVAYIAFAIHPS